MLPATKLQYDWKRRHGVPVLTEAEIIEANADWLIEHLYAPHAEMGYVADAKVIPPKMWGEPINWGDLGVVEVARHGEGWYVLVEEANPGCYYLCEYIRVWLEKWGWGPVVVKTEW